MPAGPGPWLALPAAQVCLDKATDGEAAVPGLSQGPGLRLFLDAKGDRQNEAYLSPVTHTKMLHSLRWRWGEDRQ